MAVTRMNVNRRLLAEVRGTLGYTVEEAARKIGVKPKTLASWEAGTLKPTHLQLLETSKAYSAPSALFFGETIMPEEELPDFRRAETFRPFQGPNLKLEIRYSKERREAALEIMKALDMEIPSLRFGQVRNNELLIRKMRNRFGIPVETQLTWKDSYEALKNWCRAFEGAGVLVFQSSGIEPDTMRGFSINASVLPVINLNIKDSVNGRIFTLFHELRHISSRTGAICDLHDEGIEAECNDFAGKFLVPSETLLHMDIVRNHKDEEWERSDLKRLARAFSVSQEVILRRLLALGRTTLQFYQETRDQLIRETRAAQARGFLKHEERLLRENGALFTHLLLNGYTEGVVSSRDVSNYLRGSSLDYINKLRDMLNG